MAELFTVVNRFTLMVLTLLQTVPGFDRLACISLESRRAPAERFKRRHMAQAERRRKHNA
jgi:hypothetical protein